MKSVTGQVRWHVTGRKPTRNLLDDSPDDFLAKGRTPAFNQRCSPVMTVIQTTAHETTVRFNDITDKEIPRKAFTPQSRLRRITGESPERLILRLLLARGGLTYSCGDCYHEPENPCHSPDVQ